MQPFLSTFPRLPYISIQRIGTTTIGDDPFDNYMVRFGSYLYDCESGLRRDQLIQWVLIGSGNNGTWTSADAEFYYGNKGKIWADVRLWKNEEPTGWNGFATHVERLSTHYTYSDKEKFERDFALVWGGIPIGVNATTAMMSVGHGPHELIPLGEQNTGLRETF